MPILCKSRQLRRICSHRAIHSISASFKRSATISTGPSTRPSVRKICIIRRCKCLERLARATYTNRARAVTALLAISLSKSPKFWVMSAIDINSTKPRLKRALSETFRMLKKSSRFGGKIRAMLYLQSRMNSLCILRSAAVRCKVAIQSGKAATGPRLAMRLSASLLLRKQS